MIMKYGLSEQTLDILNSIFRKFPGIKQVLIYGSRAKGNFRTGSDIDLTINVNSNFTRADFMNVIDSFDDSDLPYLIDISIYDKILNPDLIKHIDRVGKVIYSA